MAYVNNLHNYWISQQALSITLNALGEANRIQASVASGAAIICYIEGIKPADPEDPETAQNGDGLEFDNGHNFKRWSLTISPTYFNDNERKYLYVAIPKTAAIGTQAVVVFPSKKLDIYGYEMLLKPVIDEEGHMHDADGNVTDDPEQAVKSEQPGAQIGSPDYFYIWLQGIISVPTGGKREWEQKPDTGDLKTDRSLIGREDETWFRWDTLTQTVTFLKEIWMDEEGSFFNNLLAKMVKTKQLILNGHTLNGVAIKGETPPDSDDTIVTPAYLGELVDGKYLRKDQDDRTEFSLGVGGDLTVDGMTSANGGVRTEEVRSSNYTGDSIADTGFLLTANSNGHSKLTIDEIYVRMKAVFESLEVKKWSVNAGDEIWSCAANVINRVDYYADQSQAPLGYSYVRVPWLLKGIPFILSKFSEGLGRKMYAALAKVRRNLTDEQLKQVRFCRCYFLAKDGQTEIDNWWQQDDLARCQTMNVRNTARETYTTVQQKAGNVFWWRKVVRVSSSPVELEQGKSYHYFDVAYNYEAEKNDTASVYALYGSDIPAAGDHAVQFGNTVVPGRMNLMMIQVNGGSDLTYDATADAPCIKAYKGIYCFNLNKCWFGGSPLKMKLSPSTGYLFYGPEFKVVKEYGVVPVPTQRGAWADIDLETDHYTRSSVIPYSDDIVTTSSRKRWDGGSTDRVRKCYYYDEVSHKGCTWLCSIADDAHWVADETFTAGAKTFTKDKRITDADYAALSPEDKVKCSRKPNYTADEPSDLSPDWRKLVDRGTSVTSVTTKYGKSDQGTDHTRVEQWVTLDHIADLALKNGDYFWTWTHTEYSDTLEPTDVYYASRWGIDGDGIASINSYYWGTSDTALVMNAAKDRELGLYMPGDSHWAGAGPESKWFDQFGTMATANGGVGAMQGWNVWQKTVIHYDLPEGRSPSEQKPDIVNYTMSRLGIDGMMVQEEYYCLRDSDQFATAFGGYTYDKCGIRYYKLTGGVPDENGRLSTTTPNVNTDIWTNQMPVYDNSTPDKAKKKFLWNFEQRADGQGTEFASRPICIGDHSRGIKGVLELYALSASGTPQSSHHIPDDIWAANNNSETDYSKSDPTKPKTWTDELADRAPTEALPYQWNWTRTLYTTPLNAADTAKDPTTGWWYEDHWHVSAVRGTKGEDGAGTEYVYCRPQSHNADGTPLTVTLPDPNVLKDKDGVARTAAYIKQTDDFIPYQFTDNPVGIDFQHQVEYQAERKSTATTGAGGFTGGHEWGAFSSPKPWSKWGKNGMDGDGVEYVFIRTTKNVAPVLSSATATDSGGRSATDAEYLPLISNISACGAETNGKAGECTDDPKGCTRDWPYEWVAKRTMASPNAESGQRVWKTYYASVGSPYKMSPWSNYAENSMRLDLSNEMDMVQTDSTGKILAARTVETLVHFYDGAKEITLGNNDLTVTGGPDVTSANKIATFSNTASGNARKLSWAFIAGKTMAAAYNITVSFTYLGVTHTVTFTIAASMGQPIYQLKPSINVIAFSRKVANNALDPASRKLTLSVVKIDGSSTTELPVPGGLPAGFSVRYSTSTTPAVSTAGKAWGTADGTSGITWSGAEMTVANSVAIGEIFIAMFNSAGTLIDRETIPVMKDGEHGDGIKSITRTYQISASGEPGTNGKYPDDITSWVATSPAVTEAKPYLWVKEVVEYKYKTATTEYYCIGARGDNGVDAQDIEWVYIRTKTSDAPTILNDSTYTDTNGHNYTFDDHLPQVSGNANIENNGSKYQCTDDPKGVDATWKFEWEAKREKGAADANGHRAWVPYSGTMTLHNNLAESSFVIDIDNDNDQFGVDADGKVLIAQTRSTVVSMLYGTQEQAFNSAPSAALKYDDGTSVASSVAEVGVAVVSGSNNKEYRITVTIKTTGSNTPVFGASGKNGLYVDITGTCAKGTKTIRFTLEKVMGGEKGVSPTIYQLVLSQKALSYGRDASNNLVAKSNSVTVGVKETVGDATTFKTLAQSGKTCTWGFDGTYNTYTLSTSNPVITVAPTNVGSHTKVSIQLSTGDKEDIPIVTDGANGASIYKKTEASAFQVGDNGTTTPTGTWYDTKAAAIAAKPWTYDKWMWTRITITWSDNSTTVLYQTERNPKDGEPGQDIVVDGSTVVTYCASNSNSTQPTTGFGTYAAAIAKYNSDNTYCWLWSKATTKYKKATDGSSAGESTNYTVSHLAKDGNPGRGITSTNIYYTASASAPSTPSGAPSGTGWADNGNTLITNANADKHLYESTCTTYSDGTYSWTTPIDDGLISDMAATSEEFALADSNTTAPTTGWASSVTTAAGKWVWSRTKLTFKSGNPKYVNTQCVGYCGTNGSNGRSVSSITEYYKASSLSSGESASSGTWYTNVNTAIDSWGESARYLWNYESIEYTESNGSKTTVPTSPQILAIWTKDGEPGRGIDHIINHYAINDNPASYPPLNQKGAQGWDDDPIAPNADYPYLWNYETIYWTKGTPPSTDTDPQMIGHFGTDGTGYDIVFSEAYARRDKSGHVTGALRGYAYKIDGDTRTPLNGATIRYGYTSGANSTTTTSGSGYFASSGLMFDDEWTDEYCNRSYSIYASIIISNVAVHTEYISITFDGEDGDNAPYDELSYALSNQASIAAGATAPTITGNWQSTPPTPLVAYPYVWMRIQHYDSNGSLTSTSYTRLTGEKGGTGKTGKFYDYKGVWGVDVTSVTNTEKIGYYVSYNDHLWMNIYTDGQANTTTPGTDATKWEQMDDERQYYIAKAFFGDYAQFGSGIINADWLMAKNGSVNGITCNDGATCLVLGMATSVMSTTFNLKRKMTYHFKVEVTSVDALTRYIRIYNASGQILPLVNAAGTSVTYITTGSAGVYEFDCITQSNDYNNCYMQTSNANVIIGSATVTAPSGSGHEAAYTQFNPLFPDGLGTAVVISSDVTCNNSSTWQVMSDTFRLNGGLTYKIRVYCKCSNLNIGYVRIAYGKADLDGVNTIYIGEVSGTSEILLPEKTLTNTVDALDYRIIGMVNTSANNTTLTITRVEIVCEQNLHFIPAYATDLRTGKTYQNNAVIRGTVYATDGEFTGTIRATNLFHNVCHFMDGGRYSSDWYYCEDLTEMTDNDALEGWDDHTRYKVGEYYEWTAERKAGHYGTPPEGFLHCTYDADIIIMVPRSNGYKWAYNTPVYLPDPVTFDGKTVEILCKADGTNSNVSILVGCVVDDKFRQYAYFNGTSMVYPSSSTQDTLTMVETHYEAKYKLSGGSITQNGYKEVVGRVVLHAENGYWLKIE